MIRVLWYNKRAVGSPFGAERGQGIHIMSVASAHELLLLARSALAEVAVLDLPAADPQTDDVLLELRRADPALPAIVRTDAGAEDIVRLVRLGAFDVVESGAERRLVDAVIRAAETRKGRPDTNAAGETEPWRRSLVGASEALRRVMDIIRLVGSRRSTVLITGETGTGKDVVARALHMAGGRGDLPFVAVNCSAIPETLVESELFGYVKGAFTGAHQSRPGKFEQANGGTIFLDEVGELPLDVQAKLLRVLQDREVQRLGSNDTVKLNVRVIAATNVNLEQAVRQRRFREDLYYRLNVVPLRLPPLRERPSDIPALAEHFLTRICAAEDMELVRLTPSVLSRMTTFSWPGNVRQLEHAIEMAVVLSGNRRVLDLSDFPLLHSEAAPVEASPAEPLVVPDEGLDFEAAVSHFERSILQQALMRCNGNKARAAQLLRMKRTTLLARIKSLEVREMAAAAEACA